MRSASKRRGPFTHPRLVVGVPVFYWNELVEEHNLLVEYFRATAPIIRELKEADEAEGLYPPKETLGTKC